MGTGLRKKAILTVFISVAGRAPGKSCLLANTSRVAPANR